MLKPDPAVLKAAIAADPLIIKLKGEIEAQKLRERERIKALRVVISDLWKEYRKDKGALGILAGKLAAKRFHIRKKHKRTRFNMRSTKKIVGRIGIRSRIIARRVEEQFIKEQRAQFRQEMGQ
jgi:hypothetical protein